MVDVHARWALFNHGLNLDKPQGFSALGSAGVDVFFVISGFVIYLSSIRNASNPFSFMAKRLIRVVPLYWMFTLLFLGVYLFSNANAGAANTYSPLHVVESVLLLSQAFSGALPVLNQGWTLEFEMLFYLLFAIALTLKYWQARIITPTALLLVLVALGAVPSLLLEFVLGGAIAYLLSRGRASNLTAIISGVLGASSLTLATCYSFEDSQRFIFWGIPSALVVYAAVNLPQLRGGSVRKLGAASYAVYLSHIFVIEGVMRFWVVAKISASSWPLFLIVSFVGAELAGLMIYTVVDKPINLFLLSRFRKLTTNSD